MTSLQPIASMAAKTHGPYCTPVSASPRPYGYYWIMVDQDDRWLAAFWYEGRDDAGVFGHFDCSNALGPEGKRELAPSAIGGLIDVPHPLLGVPQSSAAPSGYHWVQAEECGEWVIALWRAEPYEHKGVHGHGYFDASNYWNSSCHVIVKPHAYGDLLEPK
jgi:hypothetical protein